MLPGMDRYRKKIQRREWPSIKLKTAEISRILLAVLESAIVRRCGDIPTMQTSRDHDHHTGSEGHGGFRRMSGAPRCRRGRLPHHDSRYYLRLLLSKVAARPSAVRCVPVGGFRLP